MRSRGGVGGRCAVRVVEMLRGGRCAVSVDDVLCGWSRCCVGGRCAARAVEVLCWWPSCCVVVETLHAQKTRKYVQKSVKSHMVLYGDSSLKNSLEGILRAAFKTLMQR